MRKAVLSTILLLLLVLPGCAMVAEGDGMIIPTQPFIPLEPLYIQGYPEIEYHNVTVSIDEQYAQTFVDQSFYNPYNESMNGTYVFPVPEGAMISNFELIIDGETYEAQIMDENEAKEFFREAVSERKDASLLEYINRDLFSYKVSIPAKSSRQICLQYEEFLPMHGGMYRYAYTLGTEKYSSAPINYVTVSVNIISEKGIETIYSPTHDIIVERKDSRNVRIIYEARNARPDKDIEIYYSLSNNPFGAGFLNYVDDEDGYFLFMFSPNPDQFQENIVPKDIVFVIDESGSMRGDKIVQAKDALKLILQQLHEEDRFTIVPFSTHVRKFSQLLKVANSSNIIDATRYVDGIRASGGTNINQALLDALNILRNTAKSESVKVIVFLTDGKPTSGVTGEDDIVNNVRNANVEHEVDARIFAFGVGYNVNTHLLDKISSQNHGATIYVTPDESIEMALTDFYGQISSPVLTDITLDFTGINVFETYPDVLPDVFKGSQITLAGRYSQAENIRVYLNGTTREGRAEYTFEFDVDDTKPHDFVPRLWATRKIGYLLDEIRLEGETEELVDEIKELGLEFGIVTPYTSMLIQAESGSVTDGMDNTFSLHADSGKESVDVAKGIRYYGYAERADVAVGGNIVVSGTKTFADVNGTYVDLSLLGNIITIHLGDMTTEEWLASNINITHHVLFGSDEYFALGENKGLGQILAIGPEIVFEDDGKVIYISSHSLNISNLTASVVESSVTISWNTNEPTTGFVAFRVVGTNTWIIHQDNDLKTNHSILITGLEEDFYEYYVSSTDAYGNTTVDSAGSAFHKFIIGNPIPFVISNVIVEVEENVIISWDTNIPASGTVYYRVKGTTEWRILLRIWTGTYHTKHEIVLSLDPGDYEFRSVVEIDGNITFLSLDAGEYEFYVSCYDREGRNRIDDNEGDYYSFSPADTTDVESENVQAEFSIAYLIIPFVLFLAAAVYVGVWKNELARMSNIHDLSVLEKHIEHFYSNPAMVFRLAKDLRIVKCPDCGRPFISTHKKHKCYWCGRSNN